MTNSLTNALHLLQLEDYQITRFWKYEISRQKFDPKDHTPLIWTTKVTTLYRLSLLWYLPFFFAMYFASVAFIVFPVLFIYYPGISLTLSILTLLPYELYNKSKHKKNTSRKIPDVSS